MKRERDGGRESEREREEESKRERKRERERETAYHPSPISFLSVSFPLTLSIPQDGPLLLPYFNPSHTSTATVSCVCVCVYVCVCVCVSHSTQQEQRTDEREEKHLSIMETRKSVRVGLNEWMEQ